MQLRRQSDGQVITLTSELDRGGEGRVLAVDGMPELAAKVYESSIEAPRRKLVVMLRDPPEDPRPGGYVSIAWPIDLLCTTTDDKRVVGFLMARVEGAKHVSHAYIPKDRLQWCPQFEYRYLHRTARNLAAAVQAVHERGYVIGDVSYSNVLVRDTALVALVDTDSFQVRDPDTGDTYRCPVGKEEYTPPELQGQSFADVDRKPEHDLFGLAVLIFQLLMEGMHPFNGRFKDAEEDPYPSLAERITLGCFPYRNDPGVRYEPALLALKLEVLDPEVRSLLLRCFEEGHRNPQARPGAETWVKALGAAEQELRQCAVKSRHWFGPHLPSCPWCNRAVQLHGYDSFPLAVDIQRAAQLAHVTRAQAGLPQAAPWLAPPALPARSPGTIPQRAPAAPRPWSFERTIRAFGTLRSIAFAVLVVLVALHWTGVEYRHTFQVEGTLRELGTSLSAYYSRLASAAPAGTLGELGASLSAYLSHLASQSAVASDTVVSSNRSLSDDLYCRDLIIVRGVVLRTNGYNIFCTGTLENAGMIVTGPTPYEDSPNSYGGSGGGGGAACSGRGGQRGYSTLAAGGQGERSPRNGSSPVPPAPAISYIQSWLRGGMREYLAGAGGGGNPSTGYRGTPGAYGLYIQADRIIAGSIVAKGQDSDSVHLGGGGGGVIVLAYGAGGYVAGVYDVRGGAGNPGGCYPSGAGGPGKVLLVKRTSVGIP